MLSYEPGDTVAHRLDPRSKLAFQVGFGIAAFARVDAGWLVGATVVAVGVGLAAGVAPVRTVRRFWFVLVFLVAAPLIAGVGVAPLRFDVDAAVYSGLAAGRVVPVLLVGAAYVRSTPVRETRAAVQRTVPGRPGQLLGVGIGLTVRFLPLLLADLRTARDAVRARGGGRRSAVFRARHVALIGVTRAFDRADRLSAALKARCFSWDPTLPRLSFSHLDYGVVALSALLALVPLLAP